MKKLLAITLACLMPLTAFCDVPNKVMKVENNSTVLLKIKFKATSPSLDDDGKMKIREGWGICSGVYVEKNIILSANHCVDAPEGFTIAQIWVKKNGMSEKAVVLKTDPKLDLSLLYTSLEGVGVDVAQEVHQGESCFVLGNPLGINGTITEGIVSKDNFKMKGFVPTYLIVDAVALPGNSGGAVLNSKGEIIGILVMSTSLLGVLGSSGLGIAVKLDSIRKFLK